jgi:drug/metabolite transporter (DMT)-like permease
LNKVSAHLLLFAGLLCVSTSGPFIVMARMDAFAVVFLRMAFSALLFLGYAAARRELRVAPGEGGRLALGALLLTAHFLLWVKAFDLTDYASNLLLLVAQPVMAALIGVKLGERSGRGVWASIALAVAGLVLIAGGDFTLGARAILGDAMCILGGVAITLFYVVTRQARAGTPLATFMGLVFAVGSVATVPVLLVARAPVLTYPAGSWLWMALLVVVTTVGGHGLTNLAARHVSLFTLNIVIVLEPAIAIAMGHLMFGAAIDAVTVAGGALLVGSVLVALWRPPRYQKRRTENA